jgi:hypothetical protein
MDLIGWYFLFTVTTSLTSIFEIWHPVMLMLEKQNPNHNMVQYKFISYFVFFVSNLLLAPLIILPCLIPSWGQRFRTSLLEAFLD